jgi:crotonobetainyl-CoA:carnitine CoA-transferase CaiB-like acyl-CoA transferase
MADPGADVLMVESPVGTPLRKDNLGLMQFCTRGKRSMVLDLKDPEQQESARALTDGADVVIESNRPGVMERLGLGYQALAARNPRLVYASISSYGQTGPLRNVPAHDLAIRALSGGLANGDTGAPPVTIDTTIAGAYLGLSGVLMALHAASCSGFGDWLDLSLHDVALTLQPHRMTEAATRPPSPAAPRSAFQDSYHTQDGRWICVAGRETPFVHTLMSAFGLEHLVPAVHRPDAASQQSVRSALAERFLTRTQSEWVEWFRDRDVAFAPALPFEEALLHPQVAARGMCLADAEGTVHLNTPLRFTREPAVPSLHVPAPGEHNELHATEKSTS